MGLGSTPAALHLQVPAAAVRAATLLPPQIADLQRGRQVCPVSRRVASLATAADASRWDPARGCLGPTPQSSAQTVLLPQAAAACPPRHHRPLQHPWQPTAADKGCKIPQPACHDTGMAGSVRGTWELHRPDSSFLNKEALLCGLWQAAKGCLPLAAEGCHGCSTPSRLHCGNRKAAPSMLSLMR